MAGVTGVPTGSLGRAEIDMQIQAAVLKKQVEAVRDVGTAALTLIQSAVVDPQVGQNLDISA